jgi:hypothetical protein
LKADSEDNTCMIHDYYLIIVCTWLILLWS